MHDSAGHKGKSPRDQDGADIGADHGPLVPGNVTAAGVVERADHAGQRHRHQQVNGTEAEERTVRHDGSDEEAGNGCDSHQHQIGVPHHPVQRRTLGAEKYLPGTDDEGGDHGGDMHLDGEGCFQQRRQVHGTARAGIWFFILR